MKIALCDPVSCDESLSGDGADYRGCQSTTRSGFMCQAWGLLTPHQHSHTPEANPGYGMADTPGYGMASNNYCRNPNGEEQIWCYTTSPKQRWDYCDPATFAETMGDELGLSYRGCKSKTVDGKACVKWPDFYQGRYPGHGIGDHSMCRNPIGRSGGIWCVTGSDDRPRVRLLRRGRAEERRLGGRAGAGVSVSAPFRKHLCLNMAAPQTFARTFAKPGSRLY